MTQIELEIYTEDAAEEAAFRAYWLLAEDGESWGQTVAAVRAEHGLKQQEMTRIVKECGAAYLPEVRCPRCDEAQEATSRTGVAELVRQGNVLCGPCHRAAQAEREVQARESAIRRRAELAETFTVATAPQLVAEDLSLFAAVALHALFSDPAVEDEGLTTPTTIWPKDRRWAPGSLHIDYERRLVREEPTVILAHPGSHMGAFVWEDEKPTGAFYLGQASYYLVGPQASLLDRPGPLMNELNRVFREGPWPSAWFGQWRDMWDKLSLAQASAYLDMKLGEHHLEMKQGDGTLAALSDALAVFSLGQVFNLIYRAAKDSAAYYQRGGVNKRQAANSTVGRISAAADRARANGWEIKSFGLPWNLPLSAIGQTFFSKVMWQPEVMDTLARDVQPPRHAAAPPQAALTLVPAPGVERELSDDDINDCRECGRRFYGTGLCDECKNA